MNSREKFETQFLILYKKWREWDKQTCAYGVGWNIWQYQQKIIDELKAREESRQRACDDCMMRFEGTISQLIQSMQDSAQKMFDKLGGVV